MLRAMLFDFNGVVVDDEPAHCRAFQAVFQAEGIPLTEERYYARYLPMDDHSLVKAVYADLSRPLPPPELERLVERKEEAYRAEMRRGLPLFPGVAEFIRRSSSSWPLGMGSGAAREEIEFILGGAGLRGCFLAIVAAEDVTRGKPDPECFVKALAQLNQARGRSAAEVRPEETLVFEDSPAGIRAARSAGMRSVGITNSVPADRLKEADRVVPTLAGLDPRTLEW